MFILDECAQLGTVPLLEQAVTLLRGYGLQVWTFWLILTHIF
ncbi:MAG: TraM recognition domain-containing protein [Planctomycetota bacterium]